jgi:hypothetical protein
MHQITLKSRVRLEAPRHLHVLSSQYPCGSSQPDTCHVVHEVSVQDTQGIWIRVRVLIDCGATSIFASPLLVAKLGLETEHAHITTYGIDGRVLAYTRDSRKARLPVKYFAQAPVDEPEARDLVDESEVLIVPMTAYDLVLGLQWLKTRNPEIDWEAGKLLSLRRQPKPNNHGKEAPAGLDIQMLSATAFGDLYASDKVSEGFSLTLGECGGMLGATVESHYDDGERSIPFRVGCASTRSGSGCSRRAKTCGLNDWYGLAEATKRRRTTRPGTSCVWRTVWMWISRIFKFAAS